MAKILVADDHAPTLELLAERLAMDGFTVQACREADAAFEAFAAERPALTLVAVTLPEGTGGHLARRLHATGTRTPVVVYDAEHRNRSQGIQAILDLGAQAYLPDPTNHKHLRARIDGLLGTPDPREAGAVERRARGDARPEALMDVALQAFREGWTGRLLVESPGLERRILWDAGAMVSAASTSREEGLGPWMVERGRLAPETWRDAVDLMARDGLSATGALVAVGALEAGEAVHVALKEHAADLVARLLASRRGVWRFETLAEGERPGPRLDLPTGPLLLGAVDRLLPTRFFLTALGRDLDRFPYRTEAFAERMGGLGLDPADLAFAMRITGEVPARTLVAAERRHLARAFRTIWYLSRAGVLAFSPHARASAGDGGFTVQPSELRRRPLPPEEATRLQEDSLQILTSSYFGCLGLDISAGTEEVEEAYDRLARRFHPDTWSEYDLSGVEGAMQTVMDKLQAAYRVLSVEDRRKRYLSYLLGRPDAHDRRAPLNVEAEIALRRGVNLTLAGDPAGAVEAMGEAFSLNPREPVVHCHLAFAKFLAARGTPAQRTREPRLMMRVALLMAPDLPQAHVILGVLEQVAGHPDSARKRFLKALRLDPNSPSAKAALHRLNRAPAG